MMIKIIFDATFPIICLLTMDGLFVVCLNIIVYLILSNAKCVRS